MSDPNLSASARAVNQIQSNEVTPTVEVRAGDLLPCGGDNATAPVGAPVGAHPSGSVAQRSEQGTHNPQRERRPGKTGRKTGAGGSADDADAAGVRRQGWRTLAHRDDLLPQGAIEYDRPQSVVYFLLNKGRKILYIGSTKSLGARLATHSKHKHFHHVFYVPVGPAWLAYVESALIAVHLPPMNRQSDGGYGVKWFPDEVLDYVYGELYAENADSLPRRDEVLSRRPTYSTDLRFHFNHPEDPRSRAVLFQHGVFVRETQNGFQLYDRKSHPTLPIPESPSAYLPLKHQRPAPPAGKEVSRGR